jgi:hypothetical protein
VEEQQDRYGPEEKSLGEFKADGTSDRRIGHGAIDQGILHNVREIVSVTNHEES